MNTALINNKNASSTGKNYPVSGIRVLSGKDNSVAAPAPDIETEAELLLNKVRDYTLPSSIKKQKELARLIIGVNSAGKNKSTAHQKDHLLGLTMLISSIKSSFEKLNEYLQKSGNIINKNEKKIFLASEVKPVLDSLKKEIAGIEVFFH